MLHPWHQSNCSLPSTELDKSIAGTRPLPKCCGTPQWGGGQDCSSPKSASGMESSSPRWWFFPPVTGAKRRFFFALKPAKMPLLHFRDFFWGNKFGTTKCVAKKPCSHIGAKCQRKVFFPGAPLGGSILGFFVPVPAQVDLPSGSLRRRPRRNQLPAPRRAGAAAAQAAGAAAATHGDRGAQEVCVVLADRY